jgi:hypothetical protein
MADCTEPLCAILVGQAASETLAAEYAAEYGRCPYAASYTATGRLLLGVFVLPKDKRWWIEIPAERPELLGLEHADLFFPEVVATSSPWSRGEVQPVLEAAPCGTDCGACPWYRDPCQGCPAAVAWTGS